MITYNFKERYFNCQIPLPDEILDNIDKNTGDLIEYLMLSGKLGFEVKI